MSDETIFYRPAPKESSRFGAPQPWAQNCFYLCAYAADAQRARGFIRGSDWLAADFRVQAFVNLAFSL